MAHFTRRDVLRLGSLGVGAVGLGACRPGPAATIEPQTQLPDFTVAFLTDSHVDGELGSAEGFRKAVRHALDVEQPPEFLLMGGDQPMDILATGIEEADAQFGLWDAAVEDVGQDIHVCLGNHDILGISDESPLTSDHPKYGKEYFLQHFGLERTYYSFDHEGWHFVVLDSLGIEGSGYKGWIDEEQIAWLDDDLSASGKPTVVATHIPIFSNFIEYMRGTAEGIPGGVAVVNAHEVAPVIEKHDVRLVLAGHLHINESFLYKGTEYANVGAVSGNWWRGERNGFQEGYTRLFFRGDVLTKEYVDYGWEPPPEALAEPPA